jgi:hypothetical protein
MIDRKKREKVKEVAEYFGAEKGKEVAEYFGAEAQANGWEGSFSSYKDDIAVYYGYDSYSNMPSELKTEAQVAFENGKEKEKAMTEI